ncbi:MAG: hypothetical protein AB8B65_15730 [Kordia sp.]|uniref:hypothetical protein n=1 Tax=Kordia sp. TaxID=1965332 RepID=UPI003858935E
MMKKLLYIFGFLLCISCSESAKKSENSKMKSEELSVEKDGLVDDADEKGKDLKTYRYDYNGDFKTDDKSKSFWDAPAYFTLNDFNSEISEKLQANYEAQILATKHPEFAETIKEQLADSNKFTESLSDSIQTIKIENIEFSGNIESRNDSISSQKILYTSLINSTYKQKDSVLVIIKRTFIVIDDDKKVNTSFAFETLD